MAIKSCLNLKKLQYQENKVSNGFSSTVCSNLKVSWRKKNISNWFLHLNLFPTSPISDENWKTFLRYFWYFLIYYRDTLWHFLMLIDTYWYIFAILNDHCFRRHQSTKMAITQRFAKKYFCSTHWEHALIGNFFFKNGPYLASFLDLFFLFLGTLLAYNW